MEEKTKHVNVYTNTTCFTSLNNSKVVLKKLFSTHYLMGILPSPTPTPQKISISKRRIGRFVKVRPGALYHDANITKFIDSGTGARTDAFF